MMMGLADIVPGGLRPYVYIYVYICWIISSMEQGGVSLSASGIEGKALAADAAANWRWYRGDGESWKLKQMEEMIAGFRLLSAREAGLCIKGLFAPSERIRIMDGNFGRRFVYKLRRRSGVPKWLDSWDNLVDYFAFEILDVGDGIIYRIPMMSI